MKLQAALPPSRASSRAATRSLLHSYPPPPLLPLQSADFPLSFSPSLLLLLYLITVHDGRTCCFHNQERGKHLDGQACFYCKNTWCQNISSVVGCIQEVSCHRRW